MEELNSGIIFYEELGWAFVENHIGYDLSKSHKCVECNHIWTTNQITSKRDYDWTCPDCHGKLVETEEEPSTGRNLDYNLTPEGIRYQYQSVSEENNVL